MNIFVNIYDPKISKSIFQVHSIINRSPVELVEEIILVDDASEQEHLGSELEDYVKNLPLPVSVLRTGVRSGLIRARWEQWERIFKQTWKLFNILAFLTIPNDLLVV